MLSCETKDKLARTRSCCSCKVGIWRKFASMLVLAASVFVPSLVLAADYSATIGSDAGSYYYSLTGSGGISYKSFTSSASWLTPSSTRVSTSGSSWTVNIYYSVTANTSSSSRTATLSGTISGQQIRIAITQSGCNGCSSEKHVMTLYRNNSSGDAAGARRTVADNSYYTLPTISSLGWTRSGYTFKGWSSSRGGSVEYSDGARIYVGSSLTSLYAVWQSNSSSSKHVLTLYRNNSSGDGAGARRTVTDNAYYALPTISSLGWTRSGYDFLGWSTSRGGSAVYGDGERIKVASSLNSLYAVWKAQTYIVKLHRNNSSGDGATAGRTYTVGKSRALPKIQTELKWAPRSGYEFLGWSTSKSAASATYSDGQSVSLSSTSGSTVHLYAVWKKTGGDDGYSASIGSQAGSYQYSIPFTGSGNMSISGFSSSVSWLTKNSTGIKTSSGGGTFYIIYSVTANTSTSSRTATLSGTFGGYPITVRITQSGR